MNKNMGQFDRLARTILGICLVLASIYVEPISESLLLTVLVGGFGVINIISSICSVCPMYVAVGISTCADIAADAKSDPQLGK